MNTSDALSQPMGGISPYPCRLEVSKGFRSEICDHKGTSPHAEATMHPSTNTAARLVSMTTVK